MLTKITDELWLDLDKIVRVSLEGSEIKYTIDFKEKMVTYYAPSDATRPFLGALEEHRTKGLPAIPTVEELIEEMLNNPIGDKV